MRVVSKKKARPLPAGTERAFHIPDVTLLENVFHAFGDVCRFVAFCCLLFHFCLQLRDLCAMPVRVRPAEREQHSVASRCDKTTQLCLRCAVTHLKTYTCHMSNQFPSSVIGGALCEVAVFCFCF